MIHCTCRHVRFKDLQSKVKLVLGRKSQATASKEPLYEVLKENFGSEKQCQGYQERDPWRAEVMPESLASSHGWQGPSQQGAHQQAAEIPLTWIISQLCYTAGSSPSAPGGLPPSPGSYCDGPSLPAQQQGSGSPLFPLGTLRPNRQGACLQDADRRLQAGACLHFLMFLLGSPSWRALLSPAGLPYRVGGTRAPPRCFSRRKSFSTNPGTAQCFLYTRLVHYVHTHTFHMCTFYPMPCATQLQAAYGS